jgi:cell division protein FtsZ
MGTSDTGRRVDESVEEALANPLLDIDYTGATGALIHVTGGNDMTLEEIDMVGQLITSSLHADANVIWGARVDEAHSKRITVMTIMTGVQSPHILGNETKEEKIESGNKVSTDLGITSVY